MELEKIEDVLQLGDLEKLLKKDCVQVIRKIQHLIKNEAKEESNQEDFSNLPFVAVSAVDNKFYKLKFDPESKKATVVEEFEDSRGPHMAYYAANNILQTDIRSQTKRRK